MEKTRTRLRKFNFLYILPCFAIASCVFTLIQTRFDEVLTKDYIHQKSRSLLAVSNETLVKCIPSGIDSFPNDFFTQQERQMGGVVIHIMIALYTCAMIGIVCHDYFVPSLEIISDRIKLPPDIAGATFMAIGTSAPELFSSITGSFITEGDIGVGTIIGSAVFNIVGVTGLVGVVLWSQVLDIDWYPIARDCIAYGVTILTLIWIISDNIIVWWEAFILLLIFALYIIILCFNEKIEIWSRDLVKGFQWKKCCRCCCYDSEESPLLKGRILVPEIAESQRLQKRLERDSFSVEFTASRENAILRQDSVLRKVDEILLSGEAAAKGSLCSSPTEGGWTIFLWVVMYPARLLFFISIPDSRRPKLRKLFPLTFAMSVLWIGVLSYLAVWMVTVVGYTFSVPDSVSGLTILAAGTSIPEIISSVIVAKNDEILLSGEAAAKGSLCSSPTEGGWTIFLWVVMYPARLLFFITIPDSRRPKFRKLFPLTFAMSVLWIGVLSYLAVWMVTVVGYTFSVPDSVSGLTILAAGTSIPEIISSVIVAKNGFGNMAISNLVGSNTFDISFCLGAPWLIKTLISKEGYLIVYSSALTYTTATLLITLIGFVLVFVFSGWKLNRTVGLIYFLMYVVFVIIACMYEMNVFGEINMKTCN
ncbi:hypothetical protein NPIL_79031 [Nephila pilipes]|uniref:Sodium/calcium exchanger membrane region domain-containing protein n=1 Tax=Nephila pilipes TaxID=299642 RepID=A0A8X6U8L2_NEPPI|nr:hypothetical protein NPIL_79031 [Nephila pilipes]